MMRVLLAAVLLPWAPAYAIDRAEFARLSAEFSEPEGYFDTDNLISNETTFLEVADSLKAVKGGVYIGVGPDQNFSYIARIRPDVAFLVDIRRGNLLEHILFRALFDRSRNRMEYLSLLLGRPVPDDLRSWDASSIGRIVARLDATPALGEPHTPALRAAIENLGLALGAADLATIAGFHRRFAAAGLDLRFNTHGRSPQPYYPRLRDLVTARDSSGAQASYLASEERFLFVRRMQRENRVIPVVGMIRSLAFAHA